MTVSWSDGRQSVMVDPSLIFSERGPEWLELSFAADVQVVVPRIVTEWLEGKGSLEPSLVLAPEDAELFDQRVEVLRSLGPELRAFDHNQVDLDPDAREILHLLVELGETGDVWADEWAYLQSHSWLASKLRRCLDAFQAAGVELLELGREQGIEMIEKVIPPEHLPSSINREVVLKATAKWIVVGGAQVLGDTVGSAAGAAAAGPVVGLILGKFGGHLAHEAAVRTLFAIDP